MKSTVNIPVTRTECAVLLSLASDARCHLATFRVGGGGQGYLALNFPFLTDASLCGLGVDYVNWMSMALSCTSLSLIFDLCLSILVSKDLKNFLQ